MNIQEVRLMSRLSCLLPLKDPIIKEREQIDNLGWEKHITFITNRPIRKEVIFYYLLKNKVFDYTTILTAEEIKNIYFHSHHKYDTFNDIDSSIIIISLGIELNNKEMINILNLFIDECLERDDVKAIILIYQGTERDFNLKYKTVSDRGVLNTGKLVVLNQASTTCTTANFNF